MNIFYLDKDPDKSARMLIDKHVVKMVLETGQLLSTAHRFLDGEENIRLSKTGRRMRNWTLSEEKKEKVLYKATHYNHPCSIWLRQSVENYRWLYEHFAALSSEYSNRYGKQHATWTKLKDLVKEPPQNIPHTKFTKPALAMPDEYKVPDPVHSYIQYYEGEKLQLGTQGDIDRYMYYRGQMIEDELPF